MEGDLWWCCGSSNNNWDLHAVVRSACSGGGRVTPPPPSDESFSGLQKDELMMKNTAAWQALQADPAIEDLCLEAFFAVPKPDTPQPASPRNEAPPPQQPPPAKPRTSCRNGGGPTRSRRKKKKSPVSKEVTRVPAGAPSPDLWAWRKYGQKPIKGSPYLRGYYRCSTDKDCKARKQVERCRADHTTLIVSYTGEHSHPVPLRRNSLAGTTRNKPRPPASPTSPGEEEHPQPQAAPADSGPQGTPPAPSASAGLSPTTPLICSPAGVEHEDDDEEEAVAASLLLEDAQMVAEDEALLFPKPEDAMIFSKLHEPHEATTSRSRTDGGSQAAQAGLDIAKEKFPVSGLSSWEWEAAPAASSWA